MVQRRQVALFFPAERDLKIRVSVVRFRPWPPSIVEPPEMTAVELAAARGRAVGVLFPQ